jgi:kynurenine formamidase
MIDSTSFTSTVKSLRQSPYVPHISGFASLNYRLSTPPLLPQFVEFVQPENPARNAKHPAHLNDVEAAIAYLQGEYGFGANYVLVGHSCGATLAFQLREGWNMVGPKAVLGVEGIYDLGKLVDDHRSVPMYRYFTESAFGKDEEDWTKASPTTQRCDGSFAWENAKVGAVAQSAEDELVDGG